jgi:predicted MFS family arabinose efflux permease
MSSRFAKIFIFFPLIAVFLLVRFGVIPDVARFRTTLQFSYPTYAVADNGKYYVIDHSQQRIIAADANGELRCVLDGGQRHHRGFFYAVDMAPLPDGGLYLLNGVPDERCEYFIRESIVQYDAKGNFVKNLYTLEHEPEKKENVLMNHGRLKRLHYNPDTGSLSWFELYNNRIVQCYYRDGNVAKTIFLPPPELIPDRNTADIAALGDGFVLTKKNGQIAQYVVKNKTEDSVNVSELILCDYSSTTLTDNQPVPWELDTDRYGNIYFIDLKGRSVIRIAPDKSLQTVFSAEHDIYRMNVSPDGMIAVADGKNIHLIPSAPSGNHTGNGNNNTPSVVKFPKKKTQAEQDEAVNRLSVQAAVYSEVVLKFTNRVIPFLQCLSLLILLFVIPYLGKAVYIFLLGRQLREVLLISIIVIITVLITAVIAFFGTIHKLSGIYEESVYQNISLLAMQVADSLDGGKLEQIRSAGDYDSENYILLRNDLDRRFDQNNPQLLGYIYAVYTVKNNRLFAQLYQNTAVNTAFPFEWFNDAEQGYSQVWNGGQYVSSGTDIAGDWIYALAPIRNKNGEITGILEVSRECSSFRNANRQLMQKLLLSTGICLVIMILVLIELVFMVNLIRQRGREQFFLGQKVFQKFQAFQAAESEQLRKILFGDLSPCYFERSLAFFYFIADSVSLSFLPLMMKSFYREISGVSESFILAVPYTVIMLSFGTALVLAGHFAKPKTLRLIMYTGFFCSAFGFLYAALSFNMLSFTVSQALIGFGGGLTFISIRQIVLLERDTEKSETGYAHFYAGWTAGVNAGVILGAVIADRFGYSAAFLAAFGMMILCILFEQFQLRSYIKDCSKTNNPIKENKRSPLSTLFLLLHDPRVLTLFLCNTIPTYILISFSYYYFPILADRNGVGTSAVGGVLLISGLLTVYLGPPLTAMLRRFLTHEQTVYLTAILWSGSTLFFVFTGSYLGAVLVIVSLGICDGFAEPCLNYYYLSLKGVREAGEENAIAYYELVARLGQALGPMIFATMLIFGERTGVGLIALICLTGTGIIYLVNRKILRRN